MAKLIIIRGPSGAGKSTVTQELMRVLKRPTVHIDQDVYRFIFTNDEVASPVRREMILANVLIALRRDWDVIVNGILSTKSYGDTFEKIFQAHPKENFAFYLEASFEETARRHLTRAKRHEFDAEEMREWYGLADPLGRPFETIIPETSTLEQTIATIREVAQI